MVDKPESTDDEKPAVEEVPTSEEAPVEDSPAEDAVEEKQEETPTPEVEDTGEFKLEIEQESKRKTLPVVLVLLLVIAAAVATWWFLTQNSEEEPVEETVTTAVEEAESFSQGAAVTYVDGDVEYYYLLGWSELVPGTNLRQGDKVRTGDSSRVIITLDDGSALRLDENSRVELTELYADEVVVTNLKGSVYARVSESTVRTFDVVVEDETYTALGTAYKTINTSKEEGVEVYQSEVKVDEETTIKEGKEYYTKHPDNKKVAKATNIDLVDLKDDEFVNWNKKQDEKDTDYSKKLGVLKDLEKVEEEKEVADVPAPTSSNAKITLSSATKVDKGIKVVWTNSGIYAADGYKVVYSKKTSTPTYGVDSAYYVGAGGTSAIIPVKDGNTYNFRVCAYRPGVGCDSYSNSKSATAPEATPITRGVMSATLDGSNLSWSYTGSALYGYKVVWNTTGSPVYPGDNSKFLSSTSLNLDDKITEAGTYKVRVCAYTDGVGFSEKCVDYSDEVEFVKP